MKREQLPVPDLSRMTSISSTTSKYASLLVYLTPARLQGTFDNWPVGNVSPTLLPPEMYSIMNFKKHTKITSFYIIYKVTLMTLISTHL